MGTGFPRYDDSKGRYVGGLVGSCVPTAAPHRGYRIKSGKSVGVVRAVLLRDIDLRKHGFYSFQLPLDRSRGVEADFPHALRGRDEKGLVVGHAECTVRHDVWREDLAQEVTVR